MSLFLCACVTSLWLQRIELEAHVQKGVGKTHAKWSPVCTAAYRLLPVITLLQPFGEHDADALVATCPMGVFDIEDLGLHHAPITHHGVNRSHHSH